MTETQLSDRLGASSEKNLASKGLEENLADKRTDFSSDPSLLGSYQGKYGYVTVPSLAISRNPLQYS